MGNLKSKYVKIKTKIQGCRAGAKRLRLLGFSRSQSRSRHLRAVSAPRAVLEKNQFYKQNINEMKPMKFFLKMLLKLYII